jgi:serine phosphatase RsbU (regulator of sigma subunit)
LTELLDRIRDILDVDTAAVLLLDSTSGYLVATAARGIEEEVTQGVRIPVGRGFAGRIAAEKGPVVLDRVDHTTVLNPILRARGIRSLLGVPLLHEGTVIGVLHVGTLGRRSFSTDDADLLQRAADRVALATQARLSGVERNAARALQTSLLPGRLPAVPGIEFAARYVPGDAGGVGGDWYDVFDLPSGSLCLVMGDVAGKGLRAAVVMGRLRSAVRSYALTAEDPAEILALVDRKLQHFEPGEIATVLVTRLEPANGCIEISSAGHPPPVLASPGSPSVLVELPIDPPLGADPDVQRRVSRLDIGRGAVVCLYTDGLIERRTVPLDQRLSELRGAVAADEPEAVCMSVMGRLVGTDPPADDIALLVARRTDVPTQTPPEGSSAGIPGTAIPGSTAPGGHPGRP